MYYKCTHIRAGWTFSHSQKVVLQRFSHRGVVFTLPQSAPTHSAAHSATPLLPLFPGKHLFLRLMITSLLLEERVIFM